MIVPVSNFLATFNISDVEKISPKESKRLRLLLLQRSPNAYVSAEISRQLFHQNVTNWVDDFQNSTNFANRNHNTERTSHSGRRSSRFLSHKWRCFLFVRAEDVFMVRAEDVFLRPSRRCFLFVRLFSQDKPFPLDPMSQWWWCRPACASSFFAHVLSADALISVVLIHKMCLVHTILVRGALVRLHFLRHIPSDMMKTITLTHAM